MDWLGWICAAGALLAWIIERHERNKERKELDLIKRRSSGPYLSPSSARFNWIYYDNGKPGEIGIRAMGSAASLDSVRSEVERDLPKGHEVFLILDVSGEPCPEVSVTIDGRPAQIRQEVEVDDAAGRYYLVYEYLPDRHGKKEVMELKFLSQSGIRDTHQYEIVHGHRILRRINPQ